MFSSRLLRMVVPLPSTGGGICALTGLTVTDWTAHSDSHTYRIARMVAQRLTDSTNPIQAKNLWSDLANQTKLVDELCSSSRIGNLSTTLQFLRHHNVLLHSLLRFNATTNLWHVTNDFSRTAYVGECLLRSEATARIVKVFPDVEHDVLREVTNRAAGCENLSTVYNALCLNRLLDPAGRRKVKVTAPQKAQLLLAALGEMHWFSVRTKATDRTHNNALFPPSDVLILHVLCCHCVELTISELLHAVLKPTLRRLVECAWSNFHVSIPEQFKLKPRTLGAMSLTLDPLPRPFSISDSAAASPVELRLQQQPMFSSVTSLARTKVNFKKFDALPVMAAPQRLAVSATTSRPK